MCGFVGIIDYRKQASDINFDTFIEKASSKIEHRGPDDSGRYEDDYVMLAFRRLSIIDVQGGHQPLAYGINQRYQIVFNGEIYNYIELRELVYSHGRDLNTDTDTEIIVALYSIFGTDILQLLRGMFSFLIWDREKHFLFGARDHFGIKPLYYIENGKMNMFASELKSLTDFYRHPNINDEAFQHYLSFQYVPDPSTMLEHIQKVPPGYFFTKKTGESLVLERYWKPQINPARQLNENQLKEKIQETLIDSVKVHMRSDVPVGSFLSGGVDSSIIASIAKEFHPSLKTFSVGFEQKGYSEIDVAKETADALNVENISYMVGHAEFIRELPRIIWHMDDPVADPASIPLYFIAREARKHVKVVLSGEGADELFAGYNIYKEPIDLSIFGHLPKGFKQKLKQLATVFPEGMKGKSFIERGTTVLEDRYIGNANIFSAAEKQKLISMDIQYNPTDITDHLYKDVSHLDSISKMQYIDVMTWLKGDILVKADKMTMAHSLELRVPFLDKEVFKIASSIPHELKIRHGETKYLLRQAVRDLVPPHVLNRKKLGFPVPIRNWLKDEMYDFARAVIWESGTGDFINKSYVNELLDLHCIGEADHSRRIWTVLTFMIWHQVFIENIYTFHETEQYMHI